MSVPTTSSSTPSAKWMMLKKAFGVQINRFSVKGDAKGEERFANTSDPYIDGLSSHWLPWSAPSTVSMTSGEVQPPLWSRLTASAPFHTITPRVATPRVAGQSLRRIKTDCSMPLTAFTGTAKSILHHQWGATVGYLYRKRLWRAHHRRWPMGDLPTLRVIPLRT